MSLIKTIQSRQIPLALVVLFPWIACFGAPVLSLVYQAFFSVGEAHLFDPLVIAKLKMTVFQSGISALVSGVLGFGLGWVLRHHPSAHAWLRIPFGIPSLVAVAAWTSLGVSYSLGAVIWAHVFFNVPWVALSVAQAAGSVPRTWDETAQTVGSSLWARIRWVWWPVIGPAWIVSMAQTFSWCASSFVIVLILGGGPPVETLETAIYSSVRAGTLDLRQACVLGVWQLLLGFGPGWLARSCSGRLAPERIRISVSPARKVSSSVWRRGLAAVWVFPYFVFLKDLEWSAWSDLAWRELRVALFFSLGVGVMTAFFTVLWSALAVLFLRQVPRFFESLLTLPAGVSSISLALGFWLAFARWIDPFEGSLGAWIAIQSVIFSPMVLRTFLPIAAASPVAALGVARSVGASRWQAFWWVDWPRWRMPVWNSLFLVCSASLGEVAVVSFFGSENLTTVSGLISRWMGLYQFNQAYGLSALLMGMVLLLSLGGGFFEQKNRDFFVR